MRRGFLGGAFNPPHMGHLVLAQEALVQLQLDSVTLMPMGTPPHREIADDPGAEVRFELCEATASADERLETSRLEVDREGPSYTVDTLEALKGEGQLPARVEGEREARWILMDYEDCVVHIFTPDARAFYRLEQLWGEAPARSVG